MDRMKEEPGMRRLDEVEEKVKGGLGREAGKKGGQRAQPKQAPRVAAEIEEKREQG